MPDALLPTDRSLTATTSPTVRPDVARALLCVAQLMLVLDFSIVNVALPAMNDDLRFRPGGLQWVISAYALTFGGFLMLGGRAADLFGRRVFMVGLILFSVASLAGGFARAPWVLVTARAVQGIGGAIVSPAALSLLTTTFPEGPRRNRAMGRFGTMSTIGFATLHMQQHLGYSPALTGLAFMPHAAVAIVAARLVPRVVDRFGARTTMTLGSAIVAVGLSLLAVITPGGHYATELLPGLALTSVGILFGFIASMIAATSGMPDDEQGLASGLLATSQQIGSALGLAIVLNVVGAADHRAALALDGVTGASARVIGFRYGFLVEAAFAAAAAVVALFVVRETSRGTATGTHHGVALH